MLFSHQWKYTTGEIPFIWARATYKKRPRVSDAQPILVLRRLEGYGQIPDNEDNTGMDTNWYAFDALQVFQLL